MKAVSVDGAGKRYWKLEERRGIRGLLPFGGGSRNPLWALRDVTFEVGNGETLGILGRNGSGKTTLLRMLCGVTQPTAGRVRVAGRLAPLIGVGVGFHPEMTGRENVRLNGMLLGLTPGEVAGRFDEIVAFAELAEFVDTPVKFYSSGMFVRLGFAVAVHSRPDVLLVDEVLAVGDLSYQLKCIDRMQELRDGGCTILFVSHAVNMVRTLCPRAVLLNHGHLEYDGATEGAIEQYHRLLSETADSSDTAERGQRFVGGATLLDHELSAADGPSSYVHRNVPLTYRFRVRFERQTANPVFSVNIIGDDGRAAYGVHSPFLIEHRTFAAGEEAEVRARLVNRLGGGTYRVKTAVLTADGRDVLAQDGTGVLFFVEPAPNAYGAAALEGEISVDGVVLREDRTFRVEDGSGAER